MSLPLESLLQRPLSRVLSILLAVPLALIFLIHPALFLDQQGHYNHTLLMLVMLGISGGFVHGVGFDPINHVARIILGPIMAWSLMIIGYWVLVATG